MWYEFLMMCFYFCSYDLIFIFYSIDSSYSLGIIYSSKDLL